MELIPQLEPGWPPHAWLAHCRGRQVHVRHGGRVEVAPDRTAVFEAAWAGPYAALALDEAAVVTGTGVRRRDDAVVFVSATSTVDRLHSLRLDGEALVSNSLPCLLAAAGARLAPAYHGEDLRSIQRGLSRHAGHVPTNRGDAHLTYFHNLAWDGAGLRPSPKPQPPLDTSTFGAYRAFLAEAMAALVSNMADPARATTLRPLSTLSAGYDSAAVTVLAREAGCGQALCFAQGRAGRSDEGTGIARDLGIEAVLLDDEAWQSEALAGGLPEVPFFAATADAYLLPFAAARERLAGRVLFTGFYGDSIWDLASRETGADIVRKDASGLGFTEFRLRAGFLHCPPTFWAARDIEAVAALSRSEEMRPWVTGRAYQRPIARRIIEGAGVPRGTFARRKAMVPGGTASHRREALSPASMRDYLGWLSAQGLGTSRSAVLRASDRLSWAGSTLTWRGLRAARGLPIVGQSGRLRDAERAARRRRGSRGAFRRLLFDWAIERAMAAYPREP